MNEEWRAVEGWPYEVSDEGRVKRTGAAKAARVGRSLRSAQCSGGYPMVHLKDRDRGRRVRVHELVAVAFLGPKPTPAHHVNHLNSNRADNRPENLEWATPAENAQHAARNGSFAFPRMWGEAHYKSLLTDDRVREIRATLGGRSDNAICVELGAKYGVSRATIHAVAKRLNWKHVA